ncbi:MAG: DUF222 domain-containing protein [Mycobacterium sp.]|nr:DUF222 domain-containing protein [Mycobacterium sp.]
MFDESLPGPGGLSGLSDADLAHATAGWAAASAAAEARKLAVIAEIERRARADELHQRWAVDDLDAAAAALSCALTISHGKALGQINLAVTLRDRFPKVGARFLAGQISAAMIATIGWRTALVVGEHALAQLDTEIADRAHAWGALSQHKLEQAIDFWVERYDPDAVRRARNALRGRDFTIGQRDDATGTTNVFGRLSSTDAALLDERLTTMVASVCDDDPRTLAQRRADSIGAIAAHATHLACRCDNPSCQAKIDDGRASSMTIHVIADKEAFDEARNHTPPEPTEAAEPTEPTAPAAKSEVAEAPAPAQSPRQRPAALIPGAKGTVVPAPLLAELIAHGAKVRFTGTPDDTEDCYRPSTALQEFIRTRDLTCRFPGCDRPAVHADIDHTQPWPAGPTHPGNLKCYCRLHHLIKTFWDGFTDHQNPDGTITITAPSGLTYTTKPFTRLLFPRWNTTTPPPTAATHPTLPTRPGLACLPFSGLRTK